jgi:hypothetical protein
MSRLRSERGAGLVLIIGVIAALSIMATSLVALTTNVRHNTYTDATRAKAFNVAEAAVDVSMFDLNAKWPKVSGAGPDFTAAAWTDSFRSQFAASEFPNPSSGQFVVVEYYDNQATIDKTVKWDKGQPGNDSLPDNKMYVEAQAGVGPKATRIIVLVQRIPYTTNLPRGVALCAGGDLYSTGGGNNPKIYVEVPPPPDVVPGGVTSVHVRGTIDAQDVTQTPPIAKYEGNAAKKPSDVFSPKLVEALTELAKDNGRYFTSAAAADASPVDRDWSPAGGISGLCVIDSAAGYTIRGDYNSEAQPGILMILGGGDLDYGSGGNYYGVIYVTGTVLKGHGSYIVHGMIVVDSDQDMRGTTDIYYNDNCIANLANRFSLTVKQVPNTWREIKPQ